MKINIIRNCVSGFLLIILLQIFSVCLFADISGFDFNRIAVPDEEYHNELLVKRDIAESQYNSDDVKKAHKSFKKEVKAYRKLLRKNKNSEASFKLYEIETIYSGIGAFVDDILYLNVLQAHADSNNNDVIKYSLLLLDNYYNTEFEQEVVNILGNAYVERYEEEKLIDLYGKYPEHVTDISKFQLANAYYNLDNMMKAGEYVNLSAKDKRLRMKFHCLDGLIIYNSDGAFKAIDKFKWIEKKYSKKYEKYSFVLLTLARLYFDTGNNDLASQYYEEYFALENKIIDSGILYELGTFYRIYDDQTRAKYFFTILSNNYPDSPWYADSQAQIAEIDLNLGSFEAAKSRIDEKTGFVKACPEDVCLRTGGIWSPWL